MKDKKRLVFLDFDGVINQVSNIGYYLGAYGILRLIGSWLGVSARW